MDKIKLFCFPYAGGSSLVIYNKWRRLQSECVEVIPVELPGRGKRIAEPLFTDISEVIQDIYEQIKGQISDTPFAFFGHSMGSLIAYELYYTLEREGALLPEHIFFSGGVPPHVYKSEGKHLISDNKFIKMVKKYGGLPSSFLQSKELLDLYIPILRADFQIVDTYAFAEKENKLNCDISVLCGKEDENVSNEVVGWNEYTNSTYQRHSFSGGHFYIHDYPLEILDIINSTIAKKRSRCS